MAIDVRQVVRDLRKKSTEAEQVFWNHVKNRQLEGKKILRQYPVFYEMNGTKRLFVIDFYCAEYKLGIELDGSVHDEHKDRDKIRTLIINQQGIKIIRFSNKAILENTSACLKKIQQHFHQLAPL